MNGYLKTGLIAAGAGLLLGALGGGVVVGWKKDADHRGELLAIEQDWKARLVEEQARRGRVAVAYARIDAEGTAKRRDDEKAIADLERGLRDARFELRVRARCLSSGGAATPAGVGGVDQGAAAVLDPSARQDYIDLRAGILGTERKLNACQAALTACENPSR